MSDSMTMATNILNLAKSLLGLVDELRKVDLERREKIAHLFENIRASLLSASDEIGNDRTPHGVCSEIIHYAESLAVLIRAEVGNDHADELEHTLSYVCDGKRLALPIMSEEDKAFCLTVLDEASGKFRALVNILLAA